MLALRRIAIVLLMLALLPWGAHPGAAAGQVSREPAAATAAAAIAPRLVLRAGHGRCRTALPVGPCHLDHVPSQSGAATARVPVLHGLPAAGGSASGRGEPPGLPPPRSI